MAQVEEVGASFKDEVAFVAREVLDVSPCRKLIACPTCVIGGRKYEAKSGPSTPPVGWADSIQPYLKSVQIYQGPSGLVGGQRHLDGIVLSFTGGHVKWFKGSGVNNAPTIYVINSSFAVTQQNPTFNAVNP